jgi:hypothetical protein
MRGSAAVRGLADRQSGAPKPRRKDARRLIRVKAARKGGADNGAMLSRPAHSRFAFLALLATMLLVVMPTLAQLRGPVATAHGAPRMGATHHVMSGVPREVPQVGHERHDANDRTCGYCPLLAGLLHWTATPHPAVHIDATRFASTIAEHAPRARTRLGTLGSRGPPALRAA